MPNNTNPQAIAFVDGKIRPIADRLAQLYFDAKQITAEYDGRNLGVSVMPANNDVIGTSDGRPDCTGNLALGIIYRLNEFIADYEANSKEKLVSVLVVAPNP